MVETKNETSPLHLVDNKPWYHNGLHFKCTGCGACCRGPGYVWINANEVARLANALNLSQSDFTKKYTRQVGNRLALLNDPRTEDCIFLKEGKECSVYEARPDQCQSFPWWPEQLENEEEWKEEKKRCEGIDHPDAPLIPFEEIQKHV